MAFREFSTPMQEPLYDEALKAFQEGHWETGLDKLQEVLENFPGDIEMQSFLEEMKVRSYIDQNENEDRKRKRRLKFRKVLVRFVLAAIVLSSLVYGGFRYSTWIGTQVDNARQLVEDESLALELSIKFRNAQNLLQAGRPEEAIVIFEEVKAADPNFKDIDVYLEKSETSVAIDERYDEAMALMMNREYEEALPIFEEIVRASPLYKDAAIQIQDIGRTKQIISFLEVAESAYREERWEDAVSEYESIRALDPTYRTEEIEEKLFRSYINAAETGLNDASESLEALERAENYFRKALTLRPQSGEIQAVRAEAYETFEGRLVDSYLQKAEAALTEGEADSIDVLNEVTGYLTSALNLRADDPKVQIKYALVQRYLEAVSAFGKGNWNSVIDLLEFNYSEEPGFADGTARQTLYEAYIARGNEGLASGNYELALGDFQRAAVIAQQSPDSIIRLFEAQVYVAYTQGLLLNFENSVLLYREAVELASDGASTLFEDQKLTSKIAEAEILATQGNYRLSYLTYREALNENENYYEMIIHVVGEGDYLTKLANEYRTTVAAIIAANDIINPNRITIGQEILIPIIESDL